MRKKNKFQYSRHTEIDLQLTLFCFFYAADKLDYVFDAQLLCPDFVACVLAYRDKESTA